MTAPPAAYSQFGYTLGLAERRLTAVLQEHLAKRDTRPETWYALRLITAYGPVADRGTVSAELASSRTLDSDSARELLARLASEGVIRGDAQLELTDEGETLYRSLRAYVGDAAVRFLSQFDLDDVETTVRTLQAIAERAAEEAPSPAS